MRSVSELTVIELAGVLAGPAAGAFFAELGARVIKIENPRTNGDVTRSWKLPTEDPSDPESAYYWSVNSFKEVRFVDLNTDAGRDELYDLLRSADIVITNYKKGDAEKLQLTDELLRELNERLIIAAVNGFGPHSTRTAYDLILQAESGIIAMNGSEGHPAKFPVAFIDLLAGHQLKEAILLALLERSSTGKGCRINVSLYDSAIASLANQATNWLIAGHNPRPQGTLHPNIAPYGELFETADGQLVTFAIGTQRHFSLLCEVLSTKRLAADPLFAENRDRVQNRIALAAELEVAVKRFTFEDLQEKCMLKNIPFGKIRPLSEVFAQPEARRMIREFEHNGRSIRVASTISFSIDTWK